MSRKSLWAFALIGCLAALWAPAAAGAPPGLVAPPSACAHQTDPEAPVAVQVKAMRCMTNYARQQRGKSPLAAQRSLGRAAGGKADDVLRCDQFSHTACGRSFTYWVRRVGYSGRCTAVGENLGWGSGGLSSVRTIFEAWLDSPPHRANILGGFEEIGIALRVGTLEGNDGAHVWVQTFGSRTC